MKIFDDFEENEKIQENRKKFLNKLGIELGQLVNAGLVHGASVKVVTKKDGGKIIKNTDALLTSRRDVFLSVTVADCLPIFIFDPDKEIIGIVHGGWKSLAQNILNITIEKLKNYFCCNPKNILVGIGPGIGKCHFEVGEEILKKFKIFKKECVIKKDKKIFLDLKKIAKIQLVNNGLKDKNIEINPECTYCLSDKYFSYRKDKPKEIKAMMAVIGMK